MKNIYKIQDELYIIDNNKKITQNGIWAKCSFTGDILKNRNGQYAHKVILTTNNLLIKDGVQAIDDNFLEWFVNHPTCEKVEVLTDSYTMQQIFELKLRPDIFKYKIIIPKEESKQDCKNITEFGCIKDICTCSTGPKQEIVGYRLKPSIDKMMVDGILKNAMPKWNDKDKSVYFIKGHVAGSLVAKMKELQVLDLWFTPIYENEEVKSDWLKENHLDYYYKEGIMSNEPKQESCEYIKEVGCIKDICSCNTEPKQETLEEAAERYAKKVWGVYYDDIHPDVAIIQTQGEITVKDFIEGAKWQQERMFSEEEVRLMISECFKASQDGYDITTDEIIGKFKKNKDMADFRYKGFTYELIIRPWKKGKARYEAIKWQTGFRNLWERISYDEFLKDQISAKSI